MKTIVYISIVLIALGCSGPSENKKEKVLQPAGTLTGVIGTSSIELSWSVPEESELYGVHLEQSTDNIDFVKINAFYDGRTTYRVTGLTNEVVHYFRMYYDDQKEKPSEYTPVLTITPTTGASMVDDAWALSTTSYLDAYDAFEEIIDLNLSASNQAKSGRGWMLLKINDGDKTNTNAMAQIRSDFATSLSLIDSKAGLVLVSMLEDDMPKVIISYSTFQANNTYQHPYLSHINANYLRLHAAIAEWFGNNFTKVNTYLDILDSANAPHTLDKDAQIVKLQSLLDGVPRPKR